MRSAHSRRIAVGIASGAALAAATFAGPAIAGPSHAPAVQAAQKAAKPKVTKVDHGGFPTGQTQGNSGIIVHGSGFKNVKKVTFGGVPGKHLKVLSATKLRIDAPKHAAGQVDVRVVTKAGTSKTSAKDKYAYQIYVRLAAGQSHSCQIVGATGAVRCWGSNSAGQLGNGTTGGTKTTAVKVSGLSHAVSIVAGATHNCALIANGKVKCWGSNAAGALGNGTTVPANTPQDVIGLGKPAVAIGAGFFHSCAILVDGTVKCWGFGVVGQLGNGGTANSSLPVKVKKMTGAVDIDLGIDHTCATKSNGTEWCWGFNGAHDLGDGTTTNALVPVQVVGVTNAVSTSVESETTCVLTKTHTVKCWGANNAGQTGNGTTTPVSQAVTVKGLHGVSKVAVGGQHSCAIVSGKVLCWGLNNVGQIGDNSTTSRLAPTAAQGLSKVTGLSLGAQHTLAVTKNKNTFGWGFNGDGELGNGTTTNSKVPVPVS